MTKNFFPEPVDDLCGICMKPILPGQLVYSIQNKDGRARHATCWENDNPFKQLRENLKKMEATMNRSKRDL